jgi:hypothetical protein
MRTWMGTLVAGIALLATSHAAELGPELVANGGFEQKLDHWRRDVMPHNAPITLRCEPSDTGGQCLRIAFTSERYMQGRVIQNVVAPAGATYQLEFSYRTAGSEPLKADILLLGTGPLYRGIAQTPSPSWLRKRVRFTIPAKQGERPPADGFGKKGEVVILVQNRSRATIWYDDISFRRILTNKTDESLAGFTLQPVAATDSMIFPGTAQQTANFIMRVPKGDPKAKVRLLLWGADTVAELGDFPIGDAPVQIPHAKIPVGEHQLVARLLTDTKPPVMLAEHTQRVVRLDPNLTFDESSLQNPPNLKLKGEPFFPIGMYGMRTNWRNSYWRDLRKAGFNCLHDYVFEGNPLKPIDTVAHIKTCRAYLDEAEKQGFKVMTGVPRWLAETGRRDQLTAWVEELAPHPAIAFWYSDEMVSIRHTPLRHVEALRRIVQASDPRQRAYLPFDEPTGDFVAHCDGIAWGGSGKFAGLLYRSRLGKEKPWLSVVNVSFRGRKAPSLDEQRYLTFSPVVFGARGIFFWMYSEARWHSGDPDYLGRLLQSASELSRITPAIISGEPLPPWFPKAEGKGEVTLLRCRKGKNAYLLVAPNSDQAEGTCQISIPSGVRASDLFSDKPLSAGPHQLPVPRGHVLALQLTPDQQ